MSTDSFSRRAARRVLVVDDHHDSADMLAELLAQHGVAAQTAYDGDAALDAIARSSPQLVLLDLSMPGLDGFELVRRIRAEHAAGAPRVVAVTGWVDEGTRRRTLRAGFDDLVGKPVDLDAVMRHVDASC